MFFDSACQVNLIFKTLVSGGVLLLNSKESQCNGSKG